MKTLIRFTHKVHSQDRKIDAISFQISLSLPKKEERYYYNAIKIFTANNTRKGSTQTSIRIITHFILKSRLTLWSFQD